MLLPIESVYAVTGATVYAILHNPDGTVWNVMNSAWEAYNQSNWSQYAIPLTEQAGSYYYRAAMPAGSTTVIPTTVVYLQAGGSPTLGDIVIGSAQTSGANLFAVNSNVVAASNLGLAAGSEVQGAAVSGTLSVTQMSSNLTNTLNNAYLGRSIVWTSGLLTGVAAGITAYDGTTKILSFTAVPVAPTAADTFIIV